MRFIVVVLFLILSFNLKAQLSSGLNLVVGAGVSYFFNDPSLNRRVDNTRFAGVNYVFLNKNQHLAFNPGFNLQTNQYSSKIKEDFLTQINQHVLSLTLDMLLKINKRAYLRAGLFFNQLASSDISVVNTYNRSSAFYYGSSELEKDYHSTNLQAGVTLGVSFPFKVFQRFHKFNIKIAEFASPLVKQNYILSKAMIGNETKVLSLKARPTMLSIGFDFNFNRIKKKKEAED
ncbi:hypothetical protein CNR22_07520 [Sphingobacteriaceae bacterium]|nr:hypothetical protein CNR22_07520 [Sphingobacteriaceae bacterium]